MKEAKVKTLEELRQKVEAAGTGWESFRERHLERLGRAALASKGLAEAADPAHLEKMWKENQDHWDGTRAKVKHIMLATKITETPEEIEVKRKRLIQMREDILSGKRTWSECVAESDANTKYQDGYIGPMTRHLVTPVKVAEAAWPLKVGEYSDVIRDPQGFHLVTVVERQPGMRKLQDAQPQLEMKAYLQALYYAEALLEVQRKYPIIGVQPPLRVTEIPGVAGSSATRPAGGATGSAPARPASRPRATPKPKPKPRPTTNLK
jgi:hypothetical protein